MSLINKKMTKAAWAAYKEHAWGTNELKPITERGTSAGIFGHSPHLGATIVDSLDTLYLMGLSEQFNEASAWVRTSFDIDVNTDMSLFEINIRILGGFLSAFTLTKQRVVFIFSFFYNLSPKQTFESL